MGFDGVYYWTKNGIFWDFDELPWSKLTSVVENQWVSNRNQTMIYKKMMDFEHLNVSIFSGNFLSFYAGLSMSAFPSERFCALSARSSPSGTPFFVRYCTKASTVSSRYLDHSNMNLGCCTRWGPNLKLDVCWSIHSIVSIVICIDMYGYGP